MALLSGLTTAGAAAAPAEPARLVPGQRIEDTLAAPGSRAYALHLASGQFLSLAVVQQGMDVAVTLSGPSCPTLEIDQADGRYGREPASLVAAADGTCTIGVRAKEGAGAGRFVMDSEPLRAPTMADRKRLDAEASMRDAAALRRKGTADSGRAAGAKLAEALAAWRALGDSAWEAETLLQRAGLHQSLFDHASAIADAGAALAVVRRLGDHSSMARALFLRGGELYDATEYDAALADLEEALALRSALGDRFGQLDPLWQIGWVHSRRGELRKHLENAQQGRALAHELGDASWEAWAVWNMGAARVNLGDTQGALTAFRESVALFRATADREGEAVAVQALGSALEALGDHGAALAASEDAIPILRALGSRRAEGATYATMGTIHSALGDSSKAVDLWRTAGTIFREIGARDLESSTLSKLGSELIVLKDYEQARGCLEEALRLAVASGLRAQQVSSLIGLGLLDVEKGRAAEGRARFQRAADLAASHADHAQEIRARYLLGRIANEADDPAQARLHTEAALTGLETMRSGLTSPSLRSTFMATMRDTYEQYVDVLMRLHARQPGQGLDERALEASDMSRARGLLDLLNESGLDVREGVDTALLEAERAIQDRLSAALDRQVRLTERTQGEEQARAADRQVHELSAQWEAARDRIRAANPRFGALRDPAPATVAGIRRDVLDAETVLIEYSLGEKRSYAWVVMRDTLASRELPPRHEIEKLAREAHAALIEPSGGPADQAAASALTRLGRVVLGPLAGSLRAPRLLIVADGALHYVPFGVLPDPDDPSRPLLARHEVVGAPSASVLALLRRENRGRAPAPKALAVIADPVFDRQDERLRGHAARVAAGDSTVDDRSLRALRGNGIDGALPRLPFTRREAEAILSLVPVRDRKRALDFDASRATAMSPSMAAFRIVHFASHGFLNAARPDMSGIVLSMVDREGRNARGFLTASDVFNLHLGADLVVLSGCRTALGQDLRGEGLVGLSRAFMYAGAPRVVASLWKVDDASTAELMQAFYTGILKRGLPPSAALRAAQLQLMRRPRYRHPFYWAAFQLQGEWR